MRTGRPPTSVCWVEVNNGDDAHPNYRSRLVAREFRMAGEDSIFAPAPALVSLRMVLSYAVTDFLMNLVRLEIRNVLIHVKCWPLISHELISTQ